METRQGGFLISKIHRLGGRRFDKILQQKNIDAFNGAQGKILYVLWQEGMMSVTDISRKSGLAKTTLTAMLARMKEQGLIEVHGDGNDRRAVQVSLTDKAAALKDDYEQIAAEMGEIYYRGFEEKEIKFFENCLQRILKNLEG